MPVIIQYVVERGGKTKMTFTSKVEADAYDKLLDTAERLDEFLEQSNLLQEPSERESLAMYLAENKADLLAAIGSVKKSSANKTPTKSKKGTAKDTTTSQLDLTDALPKKDLEDLVIEPDEGAIYTEEERYPEEKNTVTFDEEVANSHAA
ncbi:YebG family protein [Marinomonas sp.]|nr:YebG family protein [Marinomonas sp.]MDB4837321.1 YebG family protein [Marinomonas sp.]